MVAPLIRAFVIGGAGFVGRHLVRALLERGCEVTVGVRNIDPTGLPESVRLLDTKDRHFEEPLARALPDVVVDLAAMTQQDAAAAAAAAAFAGKTGRFVAVSSGDVYLAYGRFIGTEPGEPQPVPLTENSALRTLLFPYRASARSDSDPLFRYEKILVEREVLGRRDLNGAIVRLAKVYGPERNADFATVHKFGDRPAWRWTHVYVENAAAAIALLALHPAPPRLIYNVGELNTPTVAERLRDLPASTIPPDHSRDFDFRQNLAIDSGAIRSDLGFAEPVTYAEGLQRTLAAGAR
jgi:nucleoside-diphosphate-sugar epimerase